MNNTVEYITVDDQYADQRIDNFLINRLKGVPRSHIYQLLRSGQVRINKKRIKPSYRLQGGGDILRVLFIVIHCFSNNFFAEAVVR